VSHYTLTLKPGNESWYTKCKMITGGCPGLCISSYYKKEQERFAKTVTTASAEALAKAEQLTHIVRVRFRAFLISSLIQFLNLSSNQESKWDGLEGSLRKITNSFKILHSSFA